jgi:type III pantothenate kinase
MKLLIDLGNTRLKWALWDGTRLRSGMAVTHAGVENVDLFTLLKDIQSVDSIWVASVAAPALDTALATALRESQRPEPNFVRSVATACGVRSAYAQPERLGVDRFLALIAAHAQAQESTVIASCGTALTLDALAADGTHLGGLIAPSPELMRSALLGNTARLGDVANAADIMEIADNTADAIASGTWLAAAALVERFVIHTAARLGAMPKLVIGGGAATQLGALIAPPHRIDAELVLRGLARYADRAI